MSDRLCCKTQRGELTKSMYKRGKKDFEKQLIHFLFTHESKKKKNCLLGNISSLFCSLKPIFLGTIVTVTLTDFISHIV